MRLADEDYLHAGTTFVRWQAAFILLGAVGLAGGEVSGQERRCVVVLYPEANNGSPGNAAADKGIRDTFRSFPGNSVEVHNEYLDVSRFPDADYQADLAKFLRRKYDGRKVDLVIAGLATGLDYAVRYRAVICPGAPIVFCAVDEKEIAKRELPENVFGVPIRMDIADSLDVALNLLPKTARVYVVAGESEFDRYWEAEARTQLRSFQDRVEISFLTGLPMEDLLQEVEELPQHSLIYYLHVFKDGNGKVQIPAEALGLIAAKSAAPVFSHADSYIGYGIVGGKVFSFEEAGGEAAQLGARILGGDVPRTASAGRGENRYVFDARQLLRWNIKESALPKGSVVRFKSPTLWEAYRWQMSIVLGVVLVQGMLIIGLIIERSQRAKAEAASRAAQEGLQQSQGELRELTGKLLNAEEAERRRIARELHDDLGQGLALLSIEMDMFQQKAHSDGLPSVHVERMSGRVKQLSSSVHELSHQLHPMKLEQLGLVAAIGGLCKELSETHGISIQFQHDELPKPVSPTTALCLYRITQEGLQNVIKHSRAQRAIISLTSTGDSLVLRISDDGRGFEIAELNGQDGIGLAGMRERVRLVHGEILIESGANQGTIIQIQVPLRPLDESSID